MQDDFKPPIESRRTEDLIKIAAEPKKWQPRVVKLALEELSKRKIDSETIEEARKEIEILEGFYKIAKAEQKFDFFSSSFRRFFIDWGEVFMFLFSWEYEKDGFLHKAKVQRKYRWICLLVLLLLILTFVFYF